jgi:hypothetical protein
MMKSQLEEHTATRRRIPLCLYVIIFVLGIASIWAVPYALSGEEHNTVCTVTALKTEHNTTYIDVSFTIDNHIYYNHVISCAECATLNITSVPTIPCYYTARLASNPEEKYKVRLGTKEEKQDPGFTIFATIIGVIFGVGLILLLIFTPLMHALSFSSKDPDLSFFMRYKHSAKLFYTGGIYVGSNIDINSTEFIQQYQCNLECIIPQQIQIMLSEGHIVHHLMALKARNQVENILFFSKPKLWDQFKVDILGLLLPFVFVVQSVPFCACFVLFAFLIPIWKAAVMLLPGVIIVICFALRLHSLTRNVYFITDQRVLIADQAGSLSWVWYDEITSVTADNKALRLISTLMQSNHILNRKGVMFYACNTADEAGECERIIRSQGIIGDNEV